MRATETTYEVQRVEEELRLEEERKQAEILEAIKRAERKERDKAEAKRRAMLEAEREAERKARVQEPWPTPTLNRSVSEVRPDASVEFRLLAYLDRKSGSAGMPRPISYAVFCLKKKT
eukprot:TRINITY_DN21467_c0_g1_i4.p1 TRINITY_DN21467_c0_g1~~TRINITY_DN21467_c0_g1_i4.p1  ORF type:complete len:118 (-),score=26.46 TRINITY_DN21467_c0_g1_i4:10-363(-)